MLTPEQEKRNCKQAGGKACTDIGSSTDTETYRRIVKKRRTGGRETGGGGGGGRGEGGTNS